MTGFVKALKRCFSQNWANIKTFQWSCNVLKKFPYLPFSSAILMHLFDNYRTILKNNTKNIRKFFPQTSLV